MEGYPRIGVAAVVRHDTYVLLGERRGSHFPGTWSFPGGALEMGETIQACALRETREETGLRVRPYDPGTVVTEDRFPDGQHWITFYVPCVWVGGKPEEKEPDKHGGWNWYQWRELEDLPLFLPVFNL